MINFSDNIMFFSLLFIGGFGFVAAIFIAIYNLEKDHKNDKKIHKFKKA